jgi:hypothetical protein
LATTIDVHNDELESLDMGARIDTNQKLFFLPDLGKKDKGATINGTPAFLLNNAPFNANLVKLGTDNTDCNWLICPHLSEPDRVFNYYMSSGLIIIVMGKCFCETCLDLIVIKNDLSDFVRSCSPVNDGLFQETIINPVIDSNYNFTKEAGYISEFEKTPNTWVACSHISNKAGLNDVYSQGGQIFIFESYFTCQDCFDKIPTYSLVDVLYEGESMTDERFQKQVIDPLLSINYESLKALGHFELTLT